MITYGDLKFAAGFLLGEGYFGLNHQSTRLRVSANQVELWPLERMQELFGGRLYLNKHHQISRKTGNPTPPQHVWVVLGARAAGVCFSLFPLLSPKRREQIRKALDVWRVGAVAPQYRHRCPQGHPYSAENTYNKGRLRQHRLCKACKRVEGMQTRATVPQEVLRARQRRSREKRPEHYREAQRIYRRRRLASVLLEAV